MILFVFLRVFGRCMDLEDVHHCFFYIILLSRVVGNFLLSRASWCNPLNSLYNINKSLVGQLYRFGA